MEPTAAVIDAQSVTAAASVPATTRGFDGGKKTSDAEDLSSGHRELRCWGGRGEGHGLLARLRERHWRITRVWADGGYTGHLVDVARGAWRIALTVIKRDDDTAGFTVLPKR